MTTYISVGVSSLRKKVKTDLLEKENRNIGITNTVEVVEQILDAVSFNKLYYV